MFKFKENKAFSLIEVILVLAIMSLAIMGAYSLLFAGNKSFEISRDKGLGQQDFRLIQGYLVKELRNSTYLDKNPPNTAYPLYYSLNLRDNDDNSYSIIKTQYLEKGSSKESSFSTNIKDMRIESSEEGKLNIYILPLEEDQEMSFEILLENNLSFAKFLNISLDDLVSGKLYYAYPEDKE